MVRTVSKQISTIQSREEAMSGTVNIQDLTREALGAAMTA